MKRDWKFKLMAWMLAAAPLAIAKPDLRTARLAGTIMVYADDQKPGLFYYAPGELALAKTADGKPDLHFLQMRYTGTMANADQGFRQFRSLLSFRVAMAGPRSAELQAAKQVLRGTWRSVELRPLPIRRLEAALIYAPLAGPDTLQTPQVLPEGHFEPADANVSRRSEVYWNERIYTLKLDETTAQLFWEALQKSQIVLSVGYAFYADGIAPNQPLDELSGSPALVAALQRRLEKSNDATANEPASHLVQASAVSITVDSKKWPELFRQIDINESAPPGYAVLDVYCYDFHDNLRPELYEKRLEIAAAGVGGGRVSLVIRFNRKDLDLYAQRVRFRVAVHLDCPYSYRTIEVTNNGEMKTSSWYERQSWTQQLDITSSPPDFLEIQ